jgi:membrane protein implicated in regulation of membrane protease activity
LSPPLLATFGSTFGATGAIFERQGLDPLPVAFLAGAAGMFASVGMFFIVQKYLVQSQTSSDVHPEELVGKDAQVLIPIAKGQSGQILIITEERGRTLFPAIAADEIPRDSVVEILGFTGGVASVRKKLG